ncbi:unnamed protein product [Moneuplotes crassus]|uniref:Uncharacterized protein n=1 Tax=Euplotes crassus TaxID=5936 RepID=A0AAD2D1J2_EUPCR|nr:unnamed protein product [Moneuplotes crassus]
MKYSTNVKQYLRGVRKIQKLNLIRTPRYNYYNHIIAFFLVWYGTSYVKHNFMQSEYEVRKQPNILIPKFVYKVRREHYIYWEISRLARGFPKTFTYSNWDDQAKMMYHVDMDGNMAFEKLNFKEERIDLLDNPLLGPYIRRKDKFVFKNKPDAKNKEVKYSEKMLEEASRIAIYYLNVHKRYDLDNYLHYKPITMMDWVRAAYYGFMTKTHLADRYRNQQFLPKHDFFYNYERRTINLNLQGPDTLKHFQNMISWALFDIKILLKKLENYEETQRLKEEAEAMTSGQEVTNSEQ